MRPSPPPHSHPSPRTRALPLLVIAFLAALGFGASAQGDGIGIAPRILQRRVEKAVADNRVPGMIVRLAEPEAALEVAAGKRRRGAAPAFAVGDPVHIGSCLKAVTATIVARLVDRGVVRWETTLAEVFPELGETMAPGLRTVRFEELLAHRSGLTDEVPENFYARVLAFRGSGRAARARFVPEFLALPPLGVRGEFSYSNFGYAVVGAMLERVTGQPYELLVEREVFAPLGMRSARFGAPGSNDPRVIDAPLGHGPDGRPLLPAQQDDPPILAPAGTYSMTLADWAKFGLIQAGVPVRGKLLLSPAARQRLQTAVGGPLPEPQYGNESYGLGWSLIEVGGVPLLAHDGSNGAWLSRIVINPQTQRVLLESVNQGSESADTALNQVAFSPEVAAWLTGADPAHQE